MGNKSTSLFIKVYQYFYVKYHKLLLLSMNGSLIKKSSEKQDLLGKKVNKSPFSEEKVLHHKKTGIANFKKHKNRICLRKKGNNKNRKKKDFFPPERFIIKRGAMMAGHEYFCAWLPWNYGYQTTTVLLYFCFDKRQI